MLRMESSSSSGEGDAPEVGVGGDNPVVVGTGGDTGLGCLLATRSGSDGRCTSCSGCCSALS